MTSNFESLRKLAEKWISLDFNEETRNEMKQLLETKNVQELNTRLSSRIKFGTAGLRAKMGAGFAYMNELIIVQTTQGLVEYLLKNVEGAKEMGIIIGYDARHNSKRFAELTASVFLTKQFKVYLFSEPVPTPFIPFGVNKLKTAAGIVITASHNQKEYNGYKLYWSNGCQIIPPIDAGIAKSIEENLNVWNDIDISCKNVRNQVLDPFATVTYLYFKEIQSLKFEKESGDLNIIYTAMHGVGGKFVKRAFETFGLKPFIPVKEQFDPHPDFPTVEFPNPEEGKGALKLAIETAEKHDAKIILANDPDADRLAVAEKLDDGTWKLFNGNEIAFLLADWMYKHLKNKDKVAMCASTVSSKVLKAMGNVEGFEFYETLTGFKWIGNKAHELVQKGYQVPLCYEVEIGFTVGHTSFDKDGIRVAAVFTEMANSIYRNHSTLMKHLESLYAKYGYFYMITSYFICEETAILNKVFHHIRTIHEGNYPIQLGKFKIKYIRDLTLGYDNSQPDCKAILPTMPKDHMITFTFEDDSVCTLRNSGTEPKLKFYIECFDKNDVKVAESKARELLQAMTNDWVKPDVFGLKVKSE